MSRLEGRVEKLEESLGLTPEAAQVVKLVSSREEAEALERAGFRGTILHIVPAPPPTCSRESD